ncbi:restriction endonuclease subunit S [Streptomyces sp. NPDC001502]|uniref:restriction endonuclease subunit S n=1 Tax=Streptomyces sp. NPDC001502 TaxID=3364578 RepID=UPI0036D1AE9B
MSGWTAVKIGDLGEVVTGATPKGSESDSWGDYIDFVTPSDQEIGKRVAHPARHLSEVGADRLARRVVPANSTCFTCIGSTIGKVTLTSDRVVTNQQINSVVPNSDYDGRFVYYLLLHRSPEITQIASGSATPIINKTHFSRFIVHVPDLSIQRRIGEILGALDDKIAINECIAIAAESLGGALFDRYFAVGIQYLVDGLTLPAEWKSTDLGSATTIIETGTRPKGGVAKYTSGVPSIGAESIVRLAHFDFSKVKYVPEEFFAGMRRGVLRDRDILVYKDGGRPGDFKPHVSMFGSGFPFAQMCINEHVYRVRMNPDLGQEFGYYWLSSAPIMGEMRRRGTGAAIPGINSTAVKGIPVVEPPADQLSEFRSAAAPLVERALQAAGENRTLATLRDTLLPQLMSGKLRVRDAERIVEDAV